MTKAVELAQVASTGVSEAFKNRIINGAMVIDQRNAGALVSNAGGYITDRWSVAKFSTGGGAYSAQQISDAPVGFQNSLRVTVTTAEASQPADAFWQAFQRIEGFNTADFAFGTSSAATITLSFWVKASVSGTYSVAFFNEDALGAGARSYVTTYVINAINTWEYKTVTLQGDGVGGAGRWATTNGVGLSVIFDLGSGSNQQTTANTWVTGNFRRVSGSVRLMATNGATWQVTGVQLEVGSSATNFETRAYGTELQLCQRYYAKMLATGGTYAAFGSGAWISSTSINGFLKYPVTMRSSPTISYGGTLAISYGAGVLTNVTSVGSTYAGTDSTLWQPTTASVGTAAQPAVIMASNDATTFVAFSSEL